MLLNFFAPVEDMTKDENVDEVGHTSFDGSHPRSRKDIGTLNFDALEPVAVHREVNNKADELTIVAPIVQITEKSIKDIKKNKRKIGTDDHIEFGIG